MKVVKITFTEKRNFVKRKICSSEKLKFFSQYKIKIKHIGRIKLDKKNK